MSDSAALPHRLPLPPMKWDAWGDPAAAKPLSDGIRGLLEQVLGVDTSQDHSLDVADVRIRPSALTETQRRGLADIVGEANISTEDGDRLPRAGGKSTLDLLRRRSRDEQDAPDAVIIPATEDHIVALLDFATREQLAIVPFGGGTSVVGGVNPVRGQFTAVISLDLRHFDTLISLDEISGEATLGAGVTGPHAEELLSEHGFSLGHFPQSFQYATIGGFAATRSSGQDSAGYGRFDDMIRGLRVITPTGILDLGKAPASAAGPDLLELFAGSEGTLGIITEVRLRIHAKPDVTRYEAWSFPNFETGATALRAVEQTGTGPTVIRLSDEVETGINLATTDKIGADQITGGCLSITLFEGTDEHTRSRHEETRALLLAHGGTSLGEEPAQLWEHGRFSAPYLRDALLNAGALCETLETATSWSNLSALKTAVTEALTSSLAESGTPALVMCHISHVYPTGASLYFTVVAGQRGDALAQWQTAKSKASEAMVANGATITHHHAVGTDHKPWMTAEIGDLGATILNAVKSTVDPAGILNPGKLIP